MALRELLAVFGIKVDDKELKAADQGIQQFTDHLQTFGRALIGGVAGVAFLRFTEGLANQGDQLRDNAIRLGTNTDALQELAFAATQSGAGVQNLATGMLFLSDKVGDALSNKTGESAKAFKKWGITLKDANGQVKESDVLLAEIADKIADAKDQYQQVTIAQDFFSKSGKVMLPLLKEGADGLAELRMGARDLGGGFSKEATEAADEFNDALGRLNVVTQTARGRIAVVLLPVLGRLVDAVTAGSAKLLELAKNSSIVETVLGGLAVVAGVLALKLAIAFAPFIAAIAGFALLALLVEDVVTLFRGGKSVVGDFIDSFGGKGAAQQWVREVKDGVEGLIQAFKDLLFIKSLVDRSLSLVGTATSDPAKFAEEAKKFLQPGELERLNKLGATVGFEPQRIPDQFANAPTFGANPFTSRPVFGPQTASQAAATPSVVVQQQNENNFTVPPGTTQEQVAALRGQVEQVMKEASARARAALVGVVRR